MSVPGKAQSSMPLPELFDLLIFANILNYNFHRFQVSIQIVPRTDPKSSCLQDNSEGCFSLLV